MIRNLIVLGGLLVTAPALLAGPWLQEPVRSQDAEDETYVGEAPERYVQVRDVEGRVMVRKGELEEELTRGIPLTEGDRIEGRGRGVLQLGDGSRIVFGEGARFTLASLFVERDGAPQVVIRLESGHLRVQVAARSAAVFRVDTPSGRGTLQDRANVSFEVDGDQSVRMKVFSGRARFANDADRTTVAYGENLTVYGSRDRLNRVRDFNTYELEDFDRWAERQFKTARGQSYDRLPTSLRAYGDELDRDGEWVDVEDIGWCWRPRRLEDDWRPYWRGRWGAYATGMTWISDEPWGYVTHHHGRWGWSSRWGWYWIPGAFYAPAWVAWNVVDSFFGWAPLGYWNHPVMWGHRHWHGGYCWNVVDLHLIHHHRLHTRIRNEIRYIQPFNPGVRVGGGRLTPPWQQRPLVIRPAEVMDPGQFRTVADRGQQRARFTQIVRDNPGRVILQREPVGSRGSEDPGDRGHRQAFTQREQPVVRTPILRDPGPLQDGTRDRHRGSDRQDATQVDRDGRFRPRPDAPPRELRSDEPRRDLHRGSRTEEPRRELREEPRREEPRREIRSEEPRREPRRDVRSEEPRREGPAQQDLPADARQTLKLVAVVHGSAEP